MSDSSRTPDERTVADDLAAGAAVDSAEAGAGVEDLPPVKPPSAGFIVQLFVVPALIVLAIVGVIGLFGQLSESEQDWRELVQELGSSNQHRRWRAALGLAHLLKADQDRPAAEQRLTRNPRVAESLVALLDEQLASRSSRDDDLKQQAFLARTLGMLDVPEVVLPALQRAMHSDHDREVRKNAIASVAVVCGRHAEAEDGDEPANNPAPSSAAPGLVDDVIDVSHDSDPLIRQLAAFTLGLTPGEQSRHRLEVLLQDADPHTRENAAVALARQHSTAGWPVFQRVLADGRRAPIAAVSGDPSSVAAIEERNAAGIRLVSLKNSLKAVGDLSDEWTPEQRRELQALIEPLAEAHAEPRIRTDARQALMDLAGDG
jgi:HEAT repeat protein